MFSLSNPTAARREFVDKKVAVGDVGQDLQKISSALLEGGEEVGDKVSAKVSDKVRISVLLL